MNRNRTWRLLPVFAALLICGCAEDEGEIETVPAESIDAGVETPEPESGTLPENDMEEDADPEEDAVSRTIDDEPHGFPPVSLDSTGENHVVVMQGPDPGWSLRVDDVDRGSSPTTIYVSIVRAEPGVMHPQVITERRAGTDVEAATDTRVVARVLDHGADGEGEPYHPLADD